MAVGLKIVDGDIVINNSGTIETISETAKCTRDFGKMLVTSKEFIGNETTFDRYNTTYGTELDNKLLYNGLSRLAIRDTVIMLLNEAIASYISLQESRSNLDLGEVITYVDFDVFYDVEDLRNLLVNIKFGTALVGEVSLPSLLQEMR